MGPWIRLSPSSFTLEKLVPRAMCCSPRDYLLWNNWSLLEVNGPPLDTLTCSLNSLIRNFTCWNITHSPDCGDSVYLLFSYKNISVSLTSHLTRGSIQSQLMEYRFQTQIFVSIIHQHCTNVWIPDLFLVLVQLQKQRSINKYPTPRVTNQNTVTISCLHAFFNCTLANCLSRWMREPLPKALVRLAWKARVGYSAERTEIQRVYVQEREKTLKKRS